MDLKGKVALITGGGTGLGKSIVLQLAQEGAYVAVNYSKSAKDAEETAKEAEAFGVQTMTVQADVAKLDDIKRMVTEVSEKFGRIDILINNAGTTKFVAFPNLDGLDESDWDNIYATNTKSNFFLARAVAPIMKQNGGGHIINTVSVAGQRPTGSSIAYAVSKAATIHLTKCLALALAPEIKVNAVAPGLLLTRWANGFSDAMIEQSTNRAALKKVTDIDECAAMFISIAKNDSMTAQIITIDAGITLP
jgi:3-oxoacyl-[acyl-carrier protein] reductase